VFFGEVTRDKNKTLPDASGREKFILVTMSIVMLWMGIGSVYFTRRTAAASQAVIDQVEPQRPYEARVPGSTNILPDAKEISAAGGANR
jgi:NADH:ubiquinone oxidoreductase subunit 4 (subunit M)